MPISATAWRTSSSLNGLITAVMSFMHLSRLHRLIEPPPTPLTSTIEVGDAASMPGSRRQWIKNLRVTRRDGALFWGARSGAVRYRSAISFGFRRCRMSFLNSNGLDDLARRLADAVPESVRSFGRDLEGNFKAVLQAQLSKLDLVSRHEFDVQAALLARTQAMLTALEARLKELETKITPQ